MIPQFRLNPVEERALTRQQQTVSNLRPQSLYMNHHRNVKFADVFCQQSITPFRPEHMDEIRFVLMNDLHRLPDHVVIHLPRSHHVLNDLPLAVPTHVDWYDLESSPLLRFLLKRRMVPIYDHQLQVVDAKGNLQ